ncbi:MAG: hypothetical protein ACKVOH_04415 [Chlamydiales bacterium]
MFDDIIPFEPIHFFQLQVDISKEPVLLPFFGEEELGKVYMGWEKEGITLRFSLNRLFDAPEFPEYLSGDAVEIFLDTRDVKSQTLTRYCHHFFVLPERVDTVQAGEVTRFREEEKRELADPNLLKIHSSKVKGKRVLEIFLPSQSLYGYDPSQFGRLGFTYRIQAQDGKMQYFSASPDDFRIEQTPSLWASINLR